MAPVFGGGQDDEGGIGLVDLDGRTTATMVGRGQEAEGQTFNEKDASSQSKGGSSASRQGQGASGGRGGGGGRGRGAPEPDGAGRFNDTTQKGKNECDLHVHIENVCVFLHKETLR